MHYKLSQDYCCGIPVTFDVAIHVAICKYPSQKIREMQNTDYKG